MDFLNGGEILHHVRKEQRFSEAKAMFYAAEIIIGIGHLHKNGIIHRLVSF